GAGGGHPAGRVSLGGAEPRAQPRSRQGMPLVAQAAGVQTKREFLAGRDPGRRRLDRDEARLAVRRVEAALHEEPPVVLLRCFAVAQPTLHAIERGEGAVAGRAEPPDIVIAPAAVIEGGPRAVLPANIRRGRVTNSSTEFHPS